MISNCPPTIKYSVRDDHIYGTTRNLLQDGMKQHRNPSIKCK